MNPSERIHALLRQMSRSMLINESTTIRLFNSINSRNEPIHQAESLTSVCSVNELGYPCRICRWNQNGLPIQKCPCECKGSVGYVHFKCLRRWILHRGDNCCEICGARFNLSSETRNYKLLLRSFFQSKYLGAIFKNSAQLVILAPISYVILHQVLLIMDNMQLEENNTLQIVFLAPALLLSSSIVYFYILEFGLTRGFRIKNILKHWWNFGGQESDPAIDLNVSSEMLFF